MNFSIINWLASPTTQQEACLLLILATLFSLIGITVGRLLFQSVSHRHCVLLGTTILVFSVPFCLRMVPTGLAPQFQSWHLPASLTDSWNDSPRAPRRLSDLALPVSDGDASSSIDLTGEPFVEAESVAPTTQNRRIDSTSSADQESVAANPSDRSDGNPSAHAVTLAQSDRDSAPDGSLDLDASNADATGMLSASSMESLFGGGMRHRRQHIGTGLCAIWFAGFFCLVVRGALVQRFWTRVLSSASPWHVPERISDLLLAKYGCSCLPIVRLSSRVPNAVSGGLLVPFILLNPRLVGQLNEQQLTDVLDHELAHHARRDHWMRYMEQLVMALHWFNPAVRMLCRELAIHREQLCDEMVLRSREPLAYGETLLRVAELTIDFSKRRPHLPLGATSVLTARSELQGRIAAILARTGERIPPASKKFVGALAVALTLAGWLCSGLSSAGSFPAGSYPASDETTETSFTSEPSSTSVTAEQLAGASSRESENDVIKVRLRELQDDLARNPKVMLNLGLEDQEALLTALAVYDTEAALRTEQQLNEKQLSLRAGILKRLVADGRWEDALEVLQRHMDSGYNIQSSVLSAASMGHEAAGRNAPQAVEKSQQQLQRALDILAKSGSDSVARYRQQPDDEGSAEKVEQETAAQIAIAQLVNETASLRLLQVRDLEAVRANRPNTTEELDEKLAARMQILNRAQKALGGAPRFESFSLSRVQAENNLRFGTDWIALESWIAFHVAQPNVAEQGASRPSILVRTSHLRESIAYPRDTLGAKLSELIPQVRVGWLSNDLPAPDALITTHWLDRKLEQDEWEVVLGYLITSRQQPSDRLRLLAMTASKVRSRHPELASKLKQVLMEAWNDHDSGGSEAHLSDDAALAHIEALMETALTFFESNDRENGTRFWESGIRAWTVSISEFREERFREKFSDLVCLSAVAALAGKIETERQPEPVRKQLKDWSYSEGSREEYWTHRLRRALPTGVTLPAFPQTPAEKESEYYRLVEAEDWPAAAEECRKLGSGNRWCKRQYGKLGAASFRERGLAETLKWTSALPNLEMRLLVELGAFLAADSTSQTHEMQDNSSGQDLIIPLIVWPGPPC